MAVLRAELERKVNSGAELEASLLKAFDPGVSTLCELCQTEFSLISIHKKIFHFGNNENKCAFCGMPFVSRKRLLDHLDLHTDGSDLFCCVCLGEQKSDDALSEHLETHRELHVFLCCTCKRTFASKSGLSSHDCVPVAFVDVQDAGTAHQQPAAVVGLEFSGVAGDSRNKTDEGVGDVLPIPGDKSDLPLAPIGGVESVRIAKNSRPLMKLGQRELRLSESTFSESLSPRISHGEPLQYSNRDNENNIHAMAVRTSTGGTLNNHDGGIEIAVVKLENDTNSSTTDHSVCIDVKNEMDSVNVKFGTLSEQVTDHCIPPERTGETVSMKVEFETNQERTTDHGAGRDGSGETGSLMVGLGSKEVPGSDDCASADQNGETDSVTVEFGTHPSTPEPALSPCQHAGDVALPETPPTCQGDPGGDSFNLAQCPLTAVNTDTPNPCTSDAELPQQAALPPDLTTEEEAPEESHTDPKSTMDIRPEEALKEIDNRTVRSTRKRPHSAMIDRLNGENVTPSKAQICIGELSELQLSESPESMPTDSPAPSKKKKISFNEQIEFWNPILRERAWLDITEEFPEVREVPLLKVSPTKSKKDKKKKSKKKKKRSKSKHSRKSSSVFDEQGSPQSGSWSPEKPVDASIAGPITSDGLSTPTKPVEPRKLRPVLKPSPSPQITVPSSEHTVKGRWGRIPAHSDQLFQKFGSDFSYKNCLKVDGRFHCPDDDCRNNNDRGFSSVKGLRYHIRQHHIHAPTFDCDQCNKTFPASHKLKEHMVVHNAPDSYSCPICDKKFKTKLSVKAHQMLHDQPFRCYHCRLKFARKESLRVHLRTTKCSCCDVVLRCAELFRRHEAEVPHLYKCLGCKKKLRTLQLFNWHVRVVHYDESTAIDGTWICHVCERKFSTRHIAVRHVRNNHTNCSRDDNNDPKNG